MPAAQATANKATFSRFHDAVNTGDAEVISKTIDEVVEPDVCSTRQCRLAQRGRRRSSKCGRCSFARSPTFTLRSRI